MTAPERMQDECYPDTGPSLGNMLVLVRTEDEVVVKGSIHDDVGIEDNDAKVDQADLLHMKPYVEGHIRKTDQRQALPFSTKLFRESQWFLPNIYGEENSNYQVDYTTTPQPLPDHYLMEKIWLLCERAADHAGYEAYLRFGWQGNENTYRIVYGEACAAFLKSIPPPNDIVFSVFPNDYRTRFIKHMENVADEYAEEVMLHVMQLR